MKKLLLSLLKFIALFVPAYLVLSWFVPGMKEELLSKGLLQTALDALTSGSIAAVVILGGTWLIDRTKNKQRGKRTLFLTSSPCVPELAQATLNPANGFVDRLRQALPAHPRVLTICSDPDCHEQTDFYANQCAAAFRDAGIPFEEHRVLDGRNATQADRLIRWSNFIILSGGHVPTQNRFFKEIHLKSFLADYNGVLMGISAGTMNCAETVYAQPEEPGEAVDPNYERFLSGLGLTDLQILPHYQMIKDDVLDGLRVFEDIAYPDSRDRRFLVLPDGSYVHIRGDETQICGEAWILSDGVMSQYSEELL